MASKVKSIRLPEEVWAQIEKAAKAKDISANAYVQDAVEKALDGPVAVPATRVAEEAPKPASGTPTAPERKKRLVGWDVKGDPIYR